MQNKIFYQAKCDQSKRRRIRRACLHATHTARCVCARLGTSCGTHCLHQPTAHARLPGLADASQTVANHYSVLVHLAPLAAPRRHAGCPHAQRLFGGVPGTVQHRAKQVVILHVRAGQEHRRGARRRRCPRRLGCERERRQQRRRRVPRWGGLAPAGRSPSRSCSHSCSSGGGGCKGGRWCWCWCWCWCWRWRWCWCWRRCCNRGLGRGAISHSERTRGSISRRVSSQDKHGGSNQASPTWWLQCQR